MPYLAALTPPGWDIEHVDEEVEAVDFSRRYDLVGITFHTPSSAHAYAIADRFRARGTPVVLGGPHVTLLPDEAEQHADVVFIGEVEDTWPRFLREFSEGRHTGRYLCHTRPSLVGVPQSRKDLFHRRDGAGGILFATRGCPSRCEFCSIVEMYPGGLRRRPVDEVAREYGSFSGKVIIFWDDNIAADIEYSKDLFRAITPYRKWWSSQASIHAGRDDEFLELARRSGCKQLFLGLESVSQRSLDQAHKSFNRVSDYRDVVRNIQSHGIAVQAGVVFGFDDDDTDVFADTLGFLEDAGVQNATFNILTPYPGTPLFRRLDDEGRITTYDWSRYNARVDVVYVPKRMTARELLDGFAWINDRFYSIRSIARRLSRSPTGLYWTLPLNLRYLARAARLGTPR
jgi:radical SAM superfamily enzyme YgiQ (UPF0313 family)